MYVAEHPSLRLAKPIPQAKIVSTPSGLSPAYKMIKQIQDAPATAARQETPVKKHAQPGSRSSAASCALLAPTDIAKLSASVKFGEAIVYINTLRLSHLGALYEYKVFCSTGHTRFGDRPPRKYDFELLNGDIWIHRTQNFSADIGMCTSDPPVISTWVYFQKKGDWVQTLPDEGCMHPTPGLQPFRLQVTKNLEARWGYVKNGRSKVYQDLAATMPLATERRVWPQEERENDTGEADEMASVPDTEDDLCMGQTAHSRSKPRSRSFSIPVATMKARSVSLGAPLQSPSIALDQVGTEYEVIPATPTPTPSPPPLTSHITTDDYPMLCKIYQSKQKSLPRKLTGTHLNCS